MDVLQIMKEGHDGVRRAAGSVASLAKAGSAVSQAALDGLGKCLQLHLTVEGEYLCPEIEDRFPGAQVVVDIIKANHRVIKRVADEVWSISGASGLTPGAMERADELLTQVDRHLDSVEKLLMPKLRQFVPTFEREELGQVIQDVIEERIGDELRFGKAKSAKLAKTVKVEPSKAKTVAKVPAKRKRA